MNILVTLSVDTTDCLQFITDIEDNNFINLYNTYFSIWLNRINQRRCLKKQVVGYDVYYFMEHIQDCIENKRNVSLVFGEKVDLGLLLNNHNQKIILSQEAGRPLKDWRWIGDEFVFFENNVDGENSCVTFLYNDNQGNIVFEVSLEYPWFFGEDVPDISYNDWLSTYKILYKTVISKEIAQQWVKELNVLYEKLDANMSN